MTGIGVQDLGTGVQGEGALAQHQVIYLSSRYSSSASGTLVQYQVLQFTICYSSSILDTILQYQVLYFSIRYSSSALATLARRQLLQFSIRCPRSLFGTLGQVVLKVHEPFPLNYPHVENVSRTELVDLVLSQCKLMLNYQLVPMLNQFNVVLNQCNLVRNQCKLVLHQHNQYSTGVTYY